MIQPVHTVAVRPDRKPRLSRRRGPGSLLRLAAVVASMGASGCGGKSRLSAPEETTITVVPRATRADSASPSAPGSAATTDERAESASSPPRPARLKAPRKPRRRAARPIPAPRPQEETYPGKITVAWNAPATKIDGSPLDDFAGYRIHIGRASGQYDRTIPIAGNVEKYTITNLPPGEYFITVTAYNRDGVESQFAPEIRETVK